MAVTYKGTKFADHVGPFVRHMASVNDHRETLKSLQNSWDTLSLLGHLSNLKADMGHTRKAFDELTGELLSSLAQETLARATSGLGYKAQVAIDILTRNLFERTADIGFLAADSEVVSACASRKAQDLAALRLRFRRYAQRYSVYRDIVLLDVGGAVLARMENGFDGVSGSDVVPRAVEGRGFVETYAPTDFCGGGWALTYASAVRDEHCVGVLALEFDLAAEARLIFERLAGEEELVAFVDAAGRVVLSSDTLRLPPGHRLPMPGEVPLLRLGGQSYVAVQRKPQPYQGYEGPGWSAVALSPAELAFEHGSVEGEVSFSGEGVFSERMLAIPKQAAAIQGELDRVVWNGRLLQADDTANNFSRALLEEIAATGRRTKGVFEAATDELLETATATLLDEARFLSGLAVDMLDRNLYERACDCRWWTENTTLVAMDVERCTPVLEHINALYTVYTGIVLFDAGGRVVSTSHDASLIGHTLSGDWVEACLRTTGPMGYAVSRFGACELYGGESTYVYSAPIRHGSRTLGGIGLVFDAKPQFKAMLEAALPARAGCVGAFVRGNGIVVSSTAALPMPLPKEVLSLAAGRSWSGILVIDGACFAVGATAGSGYREFKTSDGYQEDIVAVVIAPCGALKTNRQLRRLSLRPVKGGEEIATFYIGGQVAGVRSSEVVECIEVTQAARVPGVNAIASRHCAYTTWRDVALPLVDLSEALDALEATSRHAVVLSHEGLHFGLLVSELGAIVDLQVSPSPTRTRLHGGLELVACIAQSGDDLVPMLSPAAIAAVSIAIAPDGQGETA